MRLSLLTLTIPALLWGCGGGSETSEPLPGGAEGATATAATREVTLRYGISQDVDTLDPVFQDRALDGSIMQQIFEPLVWYNDQLEMIPWLATSWEPENDGAAWVFHLKPGVHFHCGAPFNAEAVRAHFRRILDTPGSKRKTRIDRLRDIEVIDDLTVRFVLDGPFAPWPEIMRDPFAHIVCPVCAAKWGPDEFTNHPCGTGPFIFDAWQRRVRISMHRNPDWQQGRINFDRLVFLPFQEQTTRVIELLQGNLDMCDVSWQVLSDLERQPGIAVQTAPSLSVRYIAFNTQKPPFDDVRVRRAANLAVNQQEIVDHLLNGHATVSHGPLPEVLPDYNPDVRHYDYNPDEARRLLAEAGYPNGVDVVMWASELETFRVIVEAVVEDLRQVGIRAEERVFDRATYWDQFDRYIKPDGSWEPRAEGVYDMCIAGWVGGESAFGYLWPLFRSHSYSNSAFYDNPEVDNLLNEMLHTTDQAAYRHLIRECQRVIVEDAAWLFCNHGVEATAMHPWIENYHVSPAGEYRFSGVTIAPHE